MAELAQAITADQQGAQAWVLKVLAERVLGHRGGQEAHVQRLGQPPGQQFVDVFIADMGRWQVQGRPHTQCGPDFPGHGIETEAGHAAGVAGGLQVESFTVPMHQVFHGAVFHHHAFGLAGGSRGVDDVGEVRRGQAGDVGIGAVGIGAMQIDDGDITEHATCALFGQDRDRCAVLQQVSDALGRIGRVYRDVGRARLENRQQARQHLRAASAADRHTVVGLYAQRQQVMGQLVGALVELLVRQVLAVLAHGNRLRQAQGLGFESAVQGLPLRVVAGGGVEAAQQVFAFAGRQYRQLMQRRLRRVLKGLHQLLQRTVHGVAQALRADGFQRQYRQAEACAKVVHTQGQRVVAAFFAAEQLHAFPDTVAVAGHFARGAVAVVEQGAEQRHRGRHAAAPLGQRQGRMLMAQQGTEPGVGRLDAGTYRVGTHLHPQRQGVDEHAQCPVGTFAGLHAAHQYGAEHHVLTARHQPEDLGPREVHQARSADPQLPRLFTNPQRQPCIDGQFGLFDIPAIALHILHAEGQRGLVDIGEHFAEELLVFLGADTQASLGHVVTERCGGRQVIGLVEQERPHFLADHFHGRVVQCQVMEQQDRRDPLVGRVLRIHHAQQRRLGDIQAIVAGIKTRVQLFDHITIGRVQRDVLHHQFGLAPHHLHRAVQAFPHHAGAQDIVARHDLLQRAHEGLQTLDAVKRHARLQQVGVTLFGADVVVEDAFLQRRQRVDILHVGRTAGHRGHDAVDGRLVQLDQGQHRRRDVLAARRNAVGRHHDFPATAHRRRQRRQAWLVEQHPHIGAQAGLAHALDQAHRQQRMAAEFKEVVKTPDTLDLQHVLPDLRQQGFHLALRGFETTAEQRRLIRRRQALAVQLAIRGQRQQFQPDIGRRHHVVRQPALQVRSQRFNTQRRLGGVVSHQALVAGLIFTGQHHRVFHAGIAGEAAFDFTRLDTETPDFQLMVIAALVQQGAVRLPARQVAGAVQQPIAERVDDKFLGGQLRLVQVTLGHTRATDVQLANHAQRHRLLPCIQHVGTAVANRSTNRNTALTHRLDLEGGGKRRGFGGAIAIQQVLRRAVLKHPGDHLRVEHIAADDQVAQLPEHRHQPVGVLMEQPGGHPQHADGLLLQQGAKRGLGQQRGMLDHHHAAAVEQRRPHIEGAGVERRVRGEGHPVAVIEVGITVVDHQSRDGAMGHLHTLGRAG
eukprot:gene16985-biopygen17155